MFIDLGTVVEKFVVSDNICLMSGGTNDLSLKRFIRSGLSE